MKYWLIIVDDGSGGCGSMSDSGSSSDVIGKYLFKTKRNTIKYLNDTLKREETSGNKEQTAFRKEFDKFDRIENIKNGDHFGYISGNNYEIETLKLQ